MKNATHRTATLSLALLLGLAGCASTVEPGFEGFRASLERESFEGGVYLFDGDLPVESDKRLREVYTVRGLPGVGVWGPSERQRLTYCVSEAFGSEHGRVVEALGAASAMWEGAADVNFEHAAAEDGDCHAHNDAVVFDVRPVSDQPYAARAFFPNTGRLHRNLLIDLDAEGARSLDKLLEHQLGHALGLDHTRIGSALRGCEPGLDCAAGHEHEMDDSDRARARQLYGEPGAVARAARGERHDRTETGLVAAGMARELAPVAVEDGSRLRVDLYGTGDLDLYVRFGSEPTRHGWDCRPFGPDATERCEMSVPDGADYAFITVRSAAEGGGDRLVLDDYVVDIEHVVPPQTELSIPRVALIAEGAI